MARAAVLAPLALLSGLALAALRPPPAPAFAASPRVITDMRGAAVPLPLPFRGAAVLFPPSIDDFLLATNRPETLLAAQALNGDAIARGLMGRMFPALRTIPALLPGSVGTAPNVEALLAVRPSAVFAAGVLAPRLRALGLPALAIVNTLDERWLIERGRMYTEAEGMPERGRALQAAFREGVADIAALPKPEAPPRVLLAARFGRALIGYGPHVTIASPLYAAGGRSAVEAGLAVRIDHERLLRLDPDMIVLLNTWPPRLGRAQFVADPAWRSLSAVRRQRVYRILPGIEFLPDGLASWPLLARWFAELLHPDLPATLRDDMRATYRRWTGYTMTDDDLDEALAVADNHAAAEAARFERR